MGMTLKRTVAVIFFLLIVVCFVFSVFPSVVVGAEVGAAENKFDEIDPLDDLQSAGIDLLQYPFWEFGEAKLVNFVEYCYSFRANERKNYGLYLYIYNPQALDWQEHGSSVQLATSYSDKGMPNDYTKFKLKLCGYSKNPTYRKLFYKFRVVDQIGKDGKTIAERVNSNGRRYDISGVELKEEGKQLPREYKIASTYTYTGYVKGYGQNSSEEDTLSANINHMETIELDVHATNYRTLTSESGYGYQHDVNSVYFAVPNDILNKYGKLQRIKAEWYEYKTVPMVVTSDRDLYERIYNARGMLTNGFNPDISYRLHYGYHSTPSLVPGGASVSYWEWGYNVKTYTTENGASLSVLDGVQQLPIVFFANTHEIENHVVSAATVADYLYKYDASYRKGKLPLRNISADLFASGVDKGRTRGYNVQEIDTDNTFDLISAQDSSLWKDAWTKFWEFGWKLPAEEESLTGILPIYQVKASDLERDSEIIAQRLLVNANSIDGVDGLKSFYESETTADKAVFLFRFAVTDYFSRAVEAYLMNGENKTGTVTGKTYYAEESVFLNFDIIQLTFNANGEYTVIPVVSNPIDIINAITPPIDMQGDWWELLLKILMIILAVVVLVLLFAMFPPLLNLLVLCVKGVVWLITAPFRAVAWLFRKKE